MPTVPDNVERINQILMVIVGAIIVCAMGVAGLQYGPKFVGSFRGSSRRPTFERPELDFSQFTMSSSGAKYDNPNFPAMSDSMRQYFDSKSAEYESNRRLGENYRAPAPRWP